MGWLLSLVGLVLALDCVDVQAAPYRPKDDDEVLERLARPTDPKVRELRRTLVQNPTDRDAALELARTYLRLGRTQADPRYEGYAQAVLDRWWPRDELPPAVLLVRATLRQRRHDFEGALEDVTRALQQQPRSAQGWLLQAVILQVRGDHERALRSCLPLLKLADRLLAATCIASTRALQGHAETSYRRLSRTLASAAASSEAARQWATTVLAEIATALGHDRQAERHYRLALAREANDPHALAGYADLLLDQGREEEVRALLSAHARADGLLLRLAQAEDRLGGPGRERYVDDLEARIGASRRRVGPRHLRHEARFFLQLRNRPRQALQLSLENWKVQREPADARVVLEAALASGEAEAAREVLRWLAETRNEDVRLRRLADRFENGHR